MFLALFATTATLCLSFEETRGVYLRLSPLVGGPKFLPLHTAVFVEGDDRNAELVGFDFLPVKPTDPATIRRLVTLQSCPGQVRELRSFLDDTFVHLGNSSMTTEKTRELAFTLLPDDQLHLVFNQCWRHSLDLASAATGQTPLQLAYSVLSQQQQRQSRQQHLAGTSVDLEKADLEGSLAREKSRRFGLPIQQLLSDSERLQAARSAARFQEALRDEEEKGLR